MYVRNIMIRNIMFQKHLNVRNIMIQKHFAVNVHQLTCLRFYHHHHNHLNRSNHVDMPETNA